MSPPRLHHRHPPAARAIGGDISPELARLIDALAQHAVQEYLTEQAAPGCGLTRTRPNHPALPTLIDAA